MPGGASRGPGMLLHAGELLNLDLNRSWMVGDNESDIAAARSAGLAGAVHVLTGHGTRYREKALGLEARGFQVVAADNLAGVSCLLQKNFAADRSWQPSISQ